MTLETYLAKTNLSEKYQDMDRTISPEDVAKVLAIMHHMQKKDEIVKREEQKDLDLKNNKTEIKQFLEDFCKENPETNSKYIDEAVNMFYASKAVDMQLGDSKIENSYLLTLKEMGKKTLDTIKETIKSVSGGIFWIPTYFRDEIDLNDIEGNAFATFALSSLGVFGLFITTKITGLPEEIAFTPYATNSISLLYEWFRYERNKIVNSNKSKPSKQDIAKCAYDLWEKEGKSISDGKKNWYEAESLIGKARAD